MEEAANPARDAYRLMRRFCAVCDTARATDLHEICRGTSGRRLAYSKPSTWLYVCRHCHEKLGDYSIWPPARQVALKLFVDPALFSLDEINACRIAAICADDLLPFIVEFAHVFRLRHSHP